MKVFEVGYGSIDEPETVFGIYTTKEKAEARLAVVSKRMDYKPHDYHSLGIAEYDLDVDTNDDYWGFGDK